MPNRVKASGRGVAILVVAAGMLTGCSGFQDYSGDTCDGRKPAGSLEEAGKGLVAAAYAADRDGVCRVTPAFHGIPLDDAMITKTRDLLYARGITPENVVVVVGEQLGSGVPVELTDSTSNDAHAIEVFGTSVRGDGYTISQPQDAYPEERQDPTTRSSSIVSPP